MYQLLSGLDKEKGADEFVFLMRYEIRSIPFRVPRSGAVYNKQVAVFLKNQQ
jgi:hypothetical protein